MLLKICRNWMCLKTLFLSRLSLSSKVSGSGYQSVVLGFFFFCRDPDCRNFKINHKDIYI